MPYGHPEVDFLPPPFQSIQKVTVQRAERCHVENLDTWTSIRIQQEPREDGEDSGLSLSACRGRYQKDVFSFVVWGYRLFFGFVWLFDTFLSYYFTYIVF